MLVEHRVERLGTVTGADGNTYLVADGNSGANDGIPFGCPPEFRDMILAARRGDTTLIQRSYEAKHGTEFRSIQHPGHVGPRSTVKRRRFNRSAGFVVPEQTPDANQLDDLARRRATLLKLMLD